MTNDDYFNYLTQLGINAPNQRNATNSYWEYHSKDDEFEAWLLLRDKLCK